MCLVTFALDAHPDYPFVFAANRDEFFERPTRRAHFWPDAPDVVAGRDDRGGGTWCGLRRDGRFACVTNFREAPGPHAHLRSRGDLTREFLTDREDPAAYARRVGEDGGSFAGFNLLLGSVRGIHYVSNRAEQPVELGGGVYGLSNGLLDSDWPKVRRAREALRDVMTDGDVRAERLLDLLMDDVIAEDHLLPDTGFGRAWERVLSPVFIATPDYGTRSSTVIIVRADGHVCFEETLHLPGSRRAGTRRFEWTLGGEL